MKTFKRVLYLATGGVLLLQLFWAFEPDVAVERAETLVLTQKMGQSLVIDVPTEQYARVLPEFTLRTEIRNRTAIITQTDDIQYEAGVHYKFVTDKNLPRGRYTANLIVGYQLNPMRRSELDFPLAIIYVEPKHD